jgi:hypothetical protein
MALHFVQNASGWDPVVQALPRLGGVAASMPWLRQVLAALGAAAETLVSALDLPEGIAFEALRRRVRKAVAESEVGQRIGERVTELLDQSI